MRALRVIGASLLAAVVVAGGMIWATAPSAPLGSVVVPPNTDFTEGRYFAYAAPWGAQPSALLRPWSLRADAVIVDLKHFPDNTRIEWRWPPFAPRNGSGVWGYNYVAHDIYDGGLTEERVPAVRVRELRAFRQIFEWAIDNDWGDANVLTEFYLRADREKKPRSHLVEIGWFLHAPPTMRRFFEQSRLIGSYTDPTGQRWTVRMHDNYCMFALANAGDLMSGELDMLHALRWLQSRHIVNGNEWVGGVAIGAEPVTGMGTMTLKTWQVVRQ